MMAVVAEHAPPRKASAITEALLNHFGGNQVYFPVASSRARRDAAIRARIRAGAEAQEIIREYRISCSTLARILKRG